jgi:hypothetical protein
VTDDTFIVFGKRPLAQDPVYASVITTSGGNNNNNNNNKSATQKKVKGYNPTKNHKNKYLRSSPYATPVLSDPDLVPSASAEAQAKKKERDKALLKKKAQIHEDSLENSPSDFFECYVASNVIQLARNCWKLLRKTYPGLAERDSMMMNSMFEHSRLEGNIEASHSFASHNLIGTLPWSPTQMQSMDDVMMNQLQASSVFSQHSAFQSSIDETGIPLTAANQSLRLNTVSSCKTWTPHELAIQRVVRKRGGELYILTAAGTKGRMKPPHRRTRLERLESDMEHVTQQVHLLGMMEEEMECSSVLNARVEDCGGDDGGFDENKSQQLSLAEHTLQKSLELKDIKESLIRTTRQRNALRYQFDNYKLVFQGEMKDHHKLKTIKTLDKNGTLPEDEVLALSLEDKMIRRIHSLFIRGLYKGRLAKLTATRAKSVLLIQNSFRGYLGKKRFLEAVSNMKFAQSMKAIEVAMIGKARILGLKKQYKRKMGAKLIQRAWRGAMGRYKIVKKTQFFRDIKMANKVVSNDCLTPGLLETMTEEIDDFMHDHNKVLTVSIVTVVRAVLFMLNGDSPEVISIEQDEEMIEVEVFATEMSWADSLRLLRRKGRLLRRLRMLVRHVSLPSASPLEFTDTCLEHLKEVSEKVFESHFRYFHAKKPMIQLLTYVKCMKAIYDNQHLFPEYFGASSPIWFRELMTLRKRSEATAMEHCIAASSCAKLDQLKEIKIKEGKRWGLITNAYNTACSTMKYAAEAKVIAKHKMEYYISKLVKGEENKIESFQSLEQTTRLGLAISRRELADYLSTEYPSEDTIKLFNNKIDEKSIAMRDVCSAILLSKQNLERDKEARNFEHLINLEEMYKLCEELGLIVAELLMLKEEWDDFVFKIGGLQFVADLYGEKLAIFEKMKARILVCVKTRREMKIVIDQELTDQLQVVKDKASELRAISYAKRQKWDSPFPVVLEFEAEEDLDAARRDVQATNRKLKTPNHYAVADAPIVTVLLLVDCKIPKKNRNQLVDLLFKCNYGVAETLRGCDFNSVLPPIQNAISDGKSAILFVEKGIDFVTRSDFNACFRTALSSFAPTPRVLSLDGSFSLTAINWFSDLAPIHRAFLDSDECGRCSTQLMIARARGYVGLLRHCVTRALRDRVPDQSTLAPLGPSAWAHAPVWLQDLCLEDLAAVRKELLNMYHPQVDEHGYQEKLTLSLSQKWTRTITGHTPPYVVLAATVTAILGLWVSPVTEWRGKHFREGAEVFLKHSEDMPSFMDLLQLSPYPLTEPISWARIAPVMELTQVWPFLKAASLYDTPLVFVLSQWVTCAAKFLRQGTEDGGTVPVEDDTGLVESTRELDWDEDVMAVQFDSVIGDILHETMAANQIYNCKDTPIVTYIANRDYMDINYQMMKVIKSSRNVSVYQNGPDIYVEVEVDSADARGRADITQTKRYFSKITTKEFVAMLQPNSTEIFEGKIPRYVLDETFNWPEHAASFTRLVVPCEGLLSSSDAIVSQTARAKFMQCTVYGLINGHFARVEFYEEGFGVITGTVYGIGPEPVRFSIDDKEYERIVAQSDFEEERHALEQYDANLIPWIFADRLTISPSKRFSDFFEQSKYKKNISRQVKFRRMGGPGRLCGHCPVMRAGHMIIISLYEKHGAADAHMLRVCLYEPLSCRSVEFRISPLERLLLFDVKRPLIDQVKERIKLVQVDSQNTLFSPLLILHPENAPRAEDISVNRPYEVVPPSASADNDEYDDFTVDTNETYFGITFDRAAAKTQFGNVEVGISLCEFRRGFICTAQDTVTFVQTQRLINYPTACSILIDKSLREMREELSTLHDEDTVLDIVDDLMATIEVTDFEEEEEEEEEVFSVQGDRSGSGSGSGDESDKSSKAGEDEGEGSGGDDNSQSSESSHSSGNTSTTKSNDDKDGNMDIESTLELTTADSKKFISPIDYKGLSLSFVREERSAIALVCIKPAEQNPLFADFDAELKAKAALEEAEAASSAESNGQGTLCDQSDEGSGGNILHSDLSNGEESSLEGGVGVGVGVDGNGGVMHEGGGGEHGGSGRQVVHASEFGEAGGVGYIEGAEGGEHDHDEEGEGSEKIVVAKKEILVEEMPPENRVPLVNTQMMEAFETITTDLGEDEVNYGYIFPKIQEEVEETADQQTRESLHDSYASLMGNKRPYEKAFVVTKIAKKVDLGKTRVCWRSRIMPKQSKINAKDQEKAMLKRSSRVINLIPMTEIPVVEDPLYLKNEENSIDNDINKLPVVVLEILNEGPGLVERKFRIELSANNGEKIGAVDIIDDDDLTAVVGFKMKHLLQCDVDDRNMDAIFTYVMEDRLILNLMGTDRGDREGGRRTAMLTEKTKKKGGIETGQVLDLQRDTPSMFGDSDGSTTDSDGSTALTDDKKKYWVRLFTKRHRMAGRGFRTTVMFEGDNEQLYYRPDRYFDGATAHERLEELDITFNSEDLRTREVTYLTVTGEDLMEWMPDDPLSLAHALRRERFGKFLVESLHMRYTVLGDYDMYLTGMDREKCNSRTFKR